MGYPQFKKWLPNGLRITLRQHGYKWNIPCSILGLFHEQSYMLEHSYVI